MDCFGIFQDTTRRLRDCLSKLMKFQDELDIRCIIIKKAPFYKKAPPCLSRIWNKGGLSYKSAEGRKFFRGFRPVLLRKTLPKRCFCKGKCVSGSPKSSNFPPAAGSNQHNHYYFVFPHNLTPKPQKNFACGGLKTSFLNVLEHSRKTFF